MILTNRQLKHFENYQIRYMETLKDYSEDRYDIVILYYVKEVPKFFGLFGGTKEKTWEKQFTFKRSKEPTEKEGWNTYIASNDVQELKNQLDTIVKGTWHSISEENYKWLKTNHPERVV